MNASIAPRESASLSVNLFGVLAYAHRNARVERLKMRALDIEHDELIAANWNEDEPRVRRLWAELRAIRAELGGGL